MQLITGCDANAHRIVWGSTDINPQTEYLIEYLVSTKINILNKGNRTTFAISNTKEVKDLRLKTEETGT
jgi:hypothetical protein